MRILTSHFGLRPWEIGRLTDFQKSVYMSVFVEDLKFAQKNSGMRF